MPLGKAGKNKRQRNLLQVHLTLCPSWISLVYLKEDVLLNDSSWIRFAAMENLYASIPLQLKKRLQK